MPVYAWIIAIVLVTMLGAYLALLSTPKAGYRPPVSSRQEVPRNRDRALFEPVDPSQKSFPRGTWVD